MTRGLSIRLGLGRSGLWLGCASQCSATSDEDFHPVSLFINVTTGKNAVAVATC